MFSLGLGRSIVATSLMFCAAVAHGAVAPQRIAAVDGSKMSTLAGNVHAEARRAIDLGAAPADTPLEMSLRFNMTADQQAALTQLLSDQQNLASPRYHQWLTPDQFGAEFGLAAADLQQVSSWLTSQGFAVTGAAHGGLFISFTGTVAQAQSAFHTQLHSLSLNGVNHFGNLTAPALPSAIAAVTTSVTGLHDFHPKSRLRHLSADAVSPHYTSAASGNHFVAPGDFYTIYDEAPLLTAGTPINGAGIKIAIVGEIDINTADVATFRSLGGLSANPYTVVLEGTDPGQPANDPNDLLESELDVEWAGAAAPSATILFVTGRDVFLNSLTQAIDQNLAPIVSASYGECEANAQSDNIVNSFSLMFQQANAQGQTLVASAGDSGATDCESETATSAILGLAVDFPAASPNVTAIGGTMFNDAGGTYWGPNNGNAATALSYIPETPWNETTVAGTLTGGGGGVSLFFTKPVWQVGTGVPADSSRDVPDVSLNAAIDHDATLICTPTFCTSGTWKDVNGNHDIVGGTSVGAPQFAGLLALVEQKTGSRIGNANPTIYALANSAFSGNVFHDVTTGNNSMPCTPGDPNCPAGGLIGYNAGVGYDLATGWGSVDVFNMVTNWSSVTPIVSGITPVISTSTTALVTSTTAPVVQGTVINFTATVSGASAGSVQFLLDNLAQGSPVTLVGGTANFSLNTTSVSSGAHTVTAAYAGNATLVGSKSSVGIQVLSSQPADFSLTPAATTVTTSSGSTATGLVFTVNGLNSYSGTVQLSVASSANATYTLTPSSVTLSNIKTAGTSTLTLFAVEAIKGTGLTTASTKSQSPPWYAAGSGVALAGLLMLVLPKRRRFMGALVALLSIGMLAAAGCGEGGSTSTKNGGSTTGTPTGTYSVTVTANGTVNGAAATRTATVTFIVQ